MRLIAMHTCPSDWLDVALILAYHGHFDNRLPEHTGSLAKLDPLRQWQIVRPVDRIRLPPHVGFPSIRSGFPSAARLFLAAERPADLRAARPYIHVGDPAVRPFN